jgi:hypothetical protein
MKRLEVRGEVGYIETRFLRRNRVSVVYFIQLQAVIKLKTGEGEGIRLFVTK